MNAIAPDLGCAIGGLPFETAKIRVLDLACGPLGIETVPSELCSGRVLAAPVVARLDLPRFDQAAMDGYAVCSTSLTPGLSRPIAGRTAAGEPPGQLAADGVHRILTGAPMPHGADCVIAQENVVRDGDLVQIARVPQPGTNLRRRGEDIRAGQMLKPVGTTLDWRHIAVLAAQGVASVPVRVRPRVALLSSGRELRFVGRPLSPGQIHDSNQPMLAALLTSWGASVRPVPPVDDSASAMRAALCEAVRDADLVLTTAGISVGDEDHVRDALRALGGDLTVVKVAMKPGKPLAAGRLGDTLFIGLPGNPLAALAGAVGFVRPLLARLMGTGEPAPIDARASFAMARRLGRTEFIPVSLRQRGACLWADLAGPDGSGRLAPLLAADGLAFLPAAVDTVDRGELVAVLPWC